MDSYPRAYFTLPPDEDINTEASTDETESTSSDSASSSDLELSTSKSQVMLTKS